MCRFPGENVVQTTTKDTRPTIVRTLVFTSKITGKGPRENGSLVGGMEMAGEFETSSIGPFTYHRNACLQAEEICKT